MFCSGGAVRPGGCPQHTSRLYLYSIISKSFALQGLLSVAVIQQTGGARGGPTGPQSRIMVQHKSPRAGPTFPQGEAHSTSREGPQHPSWGGPTAPQRGGPQDLKRVPTAPQGRAHSPPWGCLEHPRGVSQYPNGEAHSTPGGGLLAPHMRAARA